MLYVEYHEYKTKFHNAQRDFDSILSEKELLFAKTQPKATTYDKEIVSGGLFTNTFDNYVIEKEKKNIDKRLGEARSILEDRARLLDIKERELRQSKDWYDKIYVYRFIENMPVDKIKNIMPYCRANIYNIINKILENVTKN